MSEKENASLSIVSCKRDHCTYMEEMDIVWDEPDMGRQCLKEQEPPTAYQVGLFDSILLCVSMV